MLPDLAGLTAHTPLPLLGPHLPTLLGAAAFFWAIQAGTHVWLGPQVVGEGRWGRWEGRTRRGFASHVVSQVHALIAVPLAIKSLQSPILARDPVFGYDAFVGHALAFSAGYFIWDTVDSILNSSIGFVVHGAACLAVYLFSFRPFLAGFGPCFLLWELSTPFLNVHWFMDKLELSTRYPRLYLVNAIAFMSVFFLARLCYGGYNSYVFFTTMWRERERIAWYLQFIYCTGNVALNALNWLWFSKMFAKMLSRLSGDAEEEGASEGARARKQTKGKPSSSVGNAGGAGEAQRAMQAERAGEALHETAPLLGKDQA